MTYDIINENRIAGFPDAPLPHVVFCEGEHLEGLVDAAESFYSENWIRSGSASEAAAALVDHPRQIEVLSAMSELGREAGMWESVVLIESDEPEFGVNSDGHVFPVARHGSGVNNLIPMLAAVASAERSETVALEFPETGLHVSTADALAHFIVFAASERNIRFVISSYSDWFLNVFRYSIQNDLIDHQMIKRWDVSRNNSEYRIRVVSFNSNGNTVGVHDGYGDYQRERANK